MKFFSTQTKHLILLLVVGLFVGNMATAQAAGLEYMVRENTTDTTAVSTAPTTFGWNSQIHASGTAITYFANQFQLDIGKYLVMYAQEWETTDTTNNTRKEIQGRLEVGGSMVAAGASQCYIRKNTGNQECLTSGNAILDIDSDNTTLETLFYKTDNEITGIPTREDGGSNGVQVVKLGDDWNYARYSFTTNASANTSATTFADISAWETNDEQDTGFSRSGASVTITDAGRYIVSYSLPVQKGTGENAANRTDMTSRLVLNGTEVPGTRVSTYLRGAQDTHDGVLNYIGIIDVGAGDVLKVQDLMTDDGGETPEYLEGSLEIVQLPTGAKTFIREATTGIHDPASATEFAWDTTGYLDSDAFTITSPTDSVTEVDAAGDYLFFWSMYTGTTSATGIRSQPYASVSVNDTVIGQAGYSVSGEYHRNDTNANAAGHSAGVFIPNLSSSDDISLEVVGVSDNTDDLTVDQGAMSGLRLDTLYAGAGGGGDESVSISGTLYESDGVTPITTGRTVTAAVGTSTPSLHSTTTDGSGNYSIEGVATSSFGDSWTGVDFAGSDDQWQDVTYGNGRFVAIGRDGDLAMYSDDGITWATTTITGNDDDWNGVTYGNGVFVAVGNNGDDRVATSPDGITWTGRSAAGDNDGWQTVRYLNGQFVAVGSSDDRVMTSPDGITWTAHTAAGDDDLWRDVTYANGLYVAVGDAVGGLDAVMTSPDGITWTAQTAADDDDDWYGVTYGGGLFVAVGDGSVDDSVMTSPDGITWTAQSVAGNNDFWRDVKYVNGRFIALSSSGDDRTIISPDGIAWTTSGAQSAAWRRITYGQGKLVAVGRIGAELIMYTDAGFGEDTPVTVYVDGETEKATTITYGINDAGTISGINLIEDTVRLQHSSTSGSIDLANADFYDADDDADILFDSDPGTTTINASLDVATNTTLYAPQTLVVAGDVALGGALRAERGDLHFASSTIGSLFNFKRTGEQLFVDRSTGYDKFYVSDNGLKLYMLEDNVARIDEFDLSVAWDISSATSNNASTTVGSNVEDFHFSSDGTTLFVLQDQLLMEDATIEEYSLSVAWDISSASYVDELTISESGAVYAMTMSANGTEVYVADNTGQDIRQYTLSTPWDISTGSYTSISTLPQETITRLFSLDISDDGRVLHGNGFTALGEYVMDTPYDITTLRVVATSSFAIVDENRVTDNHLVAGQKIQYFYTAITDRIVTTKSYRTLTGNLVGDNSLHSLTAETGGNLYIKDTASTSEITVASDGRLLAPTTTLDIATGYSNNGIFGHNRGTVTFSGTSTATGTMSDDSSFYSLLVQGSTTLNAVASTTNLTIDTAGSFTAPSQLLIAGGYTNNGSFSDNGGTVYFAGEQADLTNQVRAGVYDVSAEDSLPFAVAVGKNEEKLYVFGFNTVSLYEYDLLTPGDVTSASLAASTSIAGDGFTFASDIDFDPAGERMYIAEADQIAEYSLSTPWDTSTASFQSSLGASSLTAISFSPTGNRLYVLDDGGEIGQYDLSTPWDVSSLSLVATTSVSAYTNNAYGIHITPGGEKLVVTGLDDGTIQKYELSTPWDITSLSAVSNQVAVVVPNNLVGLSVTPDGTAGYMLAYQASEVVQIDFTEPATLAGAMVGSSAFNNVDFTGSVWPTFEAAASTTGTFTIASSGPKQVTFNGNDTYTFQNVDWQGTDASSTLALRSSASGTPWQLDIPGSQLNVSFVDVQDSDATLTSGGVTAASSTDSGNNTNWNFNGESGVGGSGITISGAVQDAVLAGPLIGRTVTVAVGISTPSLHSTTTDGSGNYSISGIATSSIGVWATTTAAGNNDSWLDITYGNGRFVAVGDTNGGTTDAVMTSPDGINWTVQTAAGDDDKWLGVAYRNGRFVAVGDTNGGTTDAVMTSPDGINWTVQTAAGDDDLWANVTYGNGRFVAVGDTNGGTTDAVMTSPDGINWTVQTAAGDDDLWANVTYGNGRFVAVGSSTPGTARVMYSDDGITWATSTAAGDDDLWTGVTYGNGRFVAVAQPAFGGNDTVMYSDDGITWATSTAAADNDAWNSVTYANGRFVAVGFPGAVGVDDAVMTSPDGINWTVQTAAGDDDIWTSVTYGNSRYVAVGLFTDRVMYADAGFGDSTPITVYLDGETEKATTISYGINDAGTISGINLIEDTVRLQHSSISGSINLANADFYDAEDDVDILFTATTSTTTISADLLVATSTEFIASDTLVIEGDFLNYGSTTAASDSLILKGDFTNNGTFNAEGGTVYLVGANATLNGVFTESSALNNVVVDGLVSFATEVTTADLSVLAGSVVSGDGTASSTTKISDGENGGPSLEADDFFGAAIANIGDLNSDGIVDLAVGAQNDEATSGGDAGEGAIHILFMNSDGSVASTTKISDGENGGPSLEADDFFGAAIANIGDLNSDGIVDLAVGAERGAATSGGDAGEGAIHILFMNSDGSVASTTKISDGENGGPSLEAGDFFGAAIANIGDLNSDGIVDLAVGAERGAATSGGDAREGAIHILFMNSDGSVASTTKISDGENGGPSLEANDYFGDAIANIGDFNSDGIVDLAVGATSDEATSGGDAGEGAIHILFMNSDGSVASTTKISDGENGGPSLEVGDFFGDAIANIGDLNSDGIVDLAVGATSDEATGSGAQSEGAIHILFMNSDGSVASTTKISDGENGGPSINNFSFFGAAVASIGDLNDDGVIDLVVGAIGDSATSGGDSREGALHILYMNNQVANAFTAEILTVTGNATNTGTFTLTATSSFAGTVASTGTLNALGVPVSLAGNVTSLGTFDNTNGHLTLNGTEQQTINFATTTLAINDTFEEVSFPPVGWQTGGDVVWSRTTATTSGASLGAALSGDVADDQQSWFQATTTLNATGTISFDWKVSSESGYDYLVFCVNQVTCGSSETAGSYDLEISGDQDWTTVRLELGPGENIIRFAYVKDGSVSELNDEGYIDNLRLVDGVTFLDSLTITNTSGNGTTSQAVSFLNPILTSETFTMQADTSVALAAGATSTFENVDWQGSDSMPVYLRSTNPGTQWYLDIPGSQLNVSFVDVQDSDATLTSGGVTATDSIDSGNNTNWSFGEASASEWNATDWTTFDTITIDADNIDDDLTDFPVYVDLSDLSAQFWSTTPTAASTVGTDIRVTTNDGSPVELPRELVAASSTAQTGELHFKADSISSTVDTVFRIYYNGNTAGDYTATSTYGAQNVWSNGYVGVWHLDATLVDSTGLNTETNNGTVVTNTNSKVGSGRYFDGTDDYIQTTLEHYKTVNNSTLSLWLAPDSTGDQLYVWEGESDGNGWGSQEEFSIGEAGVESLVCIEYAAGCLVEADYALSTGAAQHISATFSGLGTLAASSTLELYANGVSVGTDSNADDVPTRAGYDTALRFGRPGADQRYYEGVMDEVRISTTTRTAAWISAEYANQSTTTDFYTVNEVGDVTEWNATDWTAYDTITIDADNIDDDLTDFPVYVDLSDLSSQFWSTTPTAASTVGTDIRVTTNDGSPVELPRELVAASSTAQTGELHFKADSISSTVDTVFRIYYNGTIAGDYTATSTYGAQNVWSNGYVGVWHLDEGADGSAPQFSDSSSNGHHATGTNLTATSSVAAPIGNGVFLDANQSINFGDLGLSNQVSLSMLLDGRSIDTFTFTYSWNSDNRYQQKTFGNPEFGNVIGSNNGEMNFEGHFAITANSIGTTTQYKNGSSIVTSALGTPTLSGQELVMPELGPESFNGYIDEVRVVDGVRSASWIRAESINLSTSTDLYTAAVGVVVGTASLANSDAGQVDNAFNFMNKTNEALFAFKLTPETGNATVTEAVIELRGAKEIDVADFSNIRLYRDNDNDAEYDAGDTQVGGSGVMALDGQAGTITFPDDWLITTAANYVLVADWNYQEKGSFLTIDVLPAGLTLIDGNGSVTVSGDVDSVQHNRSNSGGGGASAATGGAAPEGDGDVGGGGKSGGDAIDTNTGGDTIGSAPDFFWPTADSGDWSNGANAYDQTDGTYASETTNGQQHAYTTYDDGVPGTDTVEGILVKLEISSSDGLGTVDVQLSWDGGTSWTSAKTTAALASTDAIVTLGGSADTWGRSWTASELNNANFAVRLTANTSSNTIFLDAIQVKVYHQATGGSGGGGGAI